MLNRFFEGGVSTGKSFVIAHCIRALVRTYNGRRTNRILICTQSDFAADAYVTPETCNVLIDQLGWTKNLVLF